ncbi:MAG: hypothetical protein EOO62_18420 [Hymenobacter sp.]|nr:MAG: hypothetical protein EOO62_18420 [Hymenobacter sp.]
MKKVLLFLSVCGLVALVWHCSQSSLDPVLLRRATQEYAARKGQLNNSRYVTIVDYRKSIVQKRLFVYDVQKQTVVLSSRVAHSFWSGLLYPTKFSNVEGSELSCTGTFLTEKGLLARFSQLRAFYGSVWPDAVPFRILLSPQLDAGTTFTNQATTVGNLVLVGTHPASRKFAEATAVVFHEMSHALSAQQRLGLQQQLEQWHLRDAQPPHRDAYHLMEEALATVAGEWLYAQQVGQPETGEWYQDSYIDRYAHALYPLMTGYIARGQQIDQAFVQEAGALFARTFPNAATEYTNLFRYVLYWTDSDDAGQVVQAFRAHFRSNYTRTITPIVGEAKPLEYIKAGDYLPVIVVTRNHEATLRYLRQQVPALRKFRLQPTQSFVLSTTGPAGPLMLVCAHNLDEVTAAAQLLNKQGHFDPAHPLVLLPPTAK